MAGMPPRWKHAPRRRRGDGLAARSDRRRGGHEPHAGACIPRRSARRSPPANRDGSSVASHHAGPLHPDRLRWELAPPDAVTFWIGPEGVSYRSASGEGRAPVSSVRFAAALEDLRTLLGGDLGQLRARWDLRARQDDAGDVEVEATVGADAGAPLRSARVLLAADLVRPRRVILSESARDNTRIDFGALVVNATIEEARMRPPG
jgi:hypothetical protein